jgi:hypothetical protein
MSYKNIPVGKTPICDPAYIRRIDPIWISGKVPNGFWLDVKNRRDYLLWAGRIMRFKWMESYYKLNFTSIKKKYNMGPIDDYWRGSPIDAVKVAVQV